MIKKIKVLLIILVIAVAAFFIINKFKGEKESGLVASEIKPALGSIQVLISTTGTVYPKNRLEIKPPVGGRLESILVQEGDKVKVGQNLAWMSSTERAALLDAAMAKGEKELRYWQDAYKPIALLAPIDAEVIVATMQPGQTVTATDAILVLSDQLIVRAQVDETDIGRIKLGQKATITLDAYPDTQIEALTEHIYYESETVNNVTIYKVDLAPDKIPDFFRSGMNATVDFKVESKEGTLLVPVEAVHKDNGEDYVLVKQAGSKEPVKRVVKLGITDDKNYEVLSGINAEDMIIVMTQKYVAPAAAKANTNPFLPSFKSRTRNSNKQ